MKVIAALALSLALLGGLAACSKEPVAARPTAAAKATEVAQVWICPMDKEVMAAQPGDCPKCGMKLEQKK